jgi:hypothetical protein
MIAIGPSGSGRRRAAWLRYFGSSVLDNRTGVKRTRACRYVGSPFRFRTDARTGEPNRVRLGIAPHPASIPPKGGKSYRNDRRCISRFRSPLSYVPPQNSPASLTIPWMK